METDERQAQDANNNRPTLILMPSIYYASLPAVVRSIAKLPDAEFGLSMLRYDALRIIGTSHSSIVANRRS
eukprot:scaffold480805_cov18-Prasinocladus_malaysianus.AAC.1